MIIAHSEFTNSARERREGSNRFEYSFSFLKWIHNSNKKADDIEVVCSFQFGIDDKIERLNLFAADIIGLWLKVAVVLNSPWN